MPNISAMPSEIAEIGSETSPPGAMMASPLGWVLTASANIASGLKPNRQSTMSDMKVAPASSRHALMICTQVVAFMPPKAT